MLGRLFKFALLALVLAMVFRWVLKPTQRAKVSEFTHLLAWALLISGGLIILGHYLGAFGGSV
ncbi:hypothetical protein HNQ59_001293 [Chitinivorax tropicus]|uniref:Uncharacterized protein n=1 Tax=Chitinivorax tropicus TaxID=714531 RepID=A0A840MH82_9PROT|nr:hypothetical protein [Chitinivorax tropicus]MBB5018008.1 hypothetical protein [Chitinivorax tropicus]